MGWPTVEVGALPSTHGLSLPDILGLIASARAFGTDEFQLVAPGGHEMTFRLLL